ncbi:MAG: hypothetical protein QG602_2987 [Verrucomicrobiota bacterium]|nr:hypothetical protein [Verrucomicrobiota bacterium]
MRITDRLRTLLSGRSLTILLVLLVNIFGKFLGFLRVQQIAVVMGATGAADALLLCLQLFSVWDVAFVSGGIATVLLPELVRRNAAGSMLKFSIVSSRFVLATEILSVAFSLVTVLACLGAGRMIAPGFDGETRDLFGTSVLVFSLYPLAITAMNLFATMQRSLGRYVLYAVNPIVINLSALIALWVGKHRGSSQEQLVMVYLLAITAATLLMAGINFALLPVQIRLNAARFLSKATGTLRHVAASTMRSIRSTAVASPLIVVTVLQSLTALITSSMASRMGAGGIAAYGYADRLSMIIYSVIVGGIFVVIEPAWARVLAVMNRREALRRIENDTLLMLLAVLPFVWVVVYAGKDVAGVVYSGMKGEEGSGLILVARIAAYCAVGMLALAVSHAFSRVIIISGHTKKIMLPNVAVLVAAIPVNLACAAWLGLPGIGLAYAILMVIQAVGYGRVLVTAGLGLAFFRPMALAKLAIFVVGTSLVAAAASVAPWPGFVRAAIVTGVGLCFSLVLGYVFKLRLERA